MSKSEQETNFVPENYSNIGSTKVKEEIEMDYENNVEFESYWMNSAVVKTEENDWNEEQPAELQYDEFTAQKSEATQKRRKRNTTDEQYEIYLKAMETNYTLISNIKNPTHANLYLKKFWDDLKEKLNKSASGPKLTSAEWKKRFKDWKNATRTKQRKMEREIRRTGGRSKPNITLTTLEKRGLAVWGKATVKNHSEPYTSCTQFAPMDTEWEPEPEHEVSITHEPEVCISHQPEVNINHQPEISHRPEASHQPEVNISHQPEVSISQPGTSTSSNWDKQFEYVNNEDSSGTNDCLLTQESSNIVCDSSKNVVPTNSTPPLSPNDESSPNTHTPNTFYRQKQPNRRINKKMKKNISFNELGAMLVEQCEGNNRITSTIANVLKDFGKKYLEIEKRKLEFQIACYKFENPTFKFD